VEKIYEIIGLGPAQYLYWFLGSLVSYSDYAELTLISVILPTLRCEWDLTSTFEAAITISAYGSYALFSSLFGKVADKYGRKTVILWSTISLVLGAIGGAASPNKWAFLASRLVTGACVGINLSCILCYTTEIGESKYRSYGVLSVVMSSSIAVVVVSGVAYFALNTVGWRWFIMIVSIPSFPTLILIFALPESPRFLCASGQQDRAMQAVRFMAKLNRKEIPDNVQMTCFDDEDLGSYTMIFNKDHRKSTIALSIVYFTNIVYDFGLIVFLPLLFSSDFCGASRASSQKCKILSNKDLLKLTIASVGSIVGIIAGFISAQYLGRLIPARVATFLTFLSLAGLLLCVNDTFTFVASTIAKTLASFTNIIIWIMIPESFPTIIRTTATGFVNACGKFGGVLGTSSVYLLFYVSPYCVIGLFAFISFAGFVGIMIYDRETRYEVLKET
jgi:putative MFS transporter